MVSENRFVTRILVLAEDGYAEPLRALVGRMLRLVDPGYIEKRIDIQAAPGSLAKGKDRQSHKRRVEIAKDIATTLFNEYFAFYHTDADRTFSDPRTDKPDNQRFYEDVLLVIVRQHIEDLKRAKNDARSTEAIMLRARLLMPYYSIEAWLLQNTQIGRELCKKHHGGEHLENFKDWERDRGALDEIEKPKEKSCFRDKYNLDLAQIQYPAQRAYNAGKSFAKAIDTLKACKALVAVLAATYAGREGQDA